MERDFWKRGERCRGQALFREPEGWREESHSDGITLSHCILGAIDDPIQLLPCRWCHATDATPSVHFHDHIALGDSSG